MYNMFFKCMFAQGTILKEQTAKYYLRIFTAEKTWQLIKIAL